MLYVDMTKVGNHKIQVGIFRGLIDFTVELDSALSDHLKEAMIFKGTSKTVQNEFLDAIKVKFRLLIGNNNLFYIFMFNSSIKLCPPISKGYEAPLPISC